MTTKTFTPRAGDIERQWFVVDAEGKTLGRLASQIAHILRGKHKPTYSPHMDLGDHIVVINTVEGDDQLAGEVYGIALRDRILVNSFDRPDLSNIGMPALVDPGHLRLAGSTSNASPGLARRLREDLEHLFDEEFVRYLSQLGRVRAHLKKVAAGDDGRFEILHSLVADFRLNGSIDYPAGWRQRVADLLSRRKPSESETGEVSAR